MASDIRKQISAAAENSRNGQVFVDHAGKRHWNTTGGVLMEKILYDLMDWAGIEELVYSEASDPLFLSRCFFVRIVRAASM